MLLSRLKKNLDLNLDIVCDCEIDGITKDISSGYNKIYVLRSAKSSDIKKEASDAIKNGFRNILTDTNYVNKSINIIYTNNILKSNASILIYLYKKYLNKIPLIGVTGTNGKTTTSTLIYSFFKYVNKKSILIGSNGIYTTDDKIRTNNTTPDLDIILEYIKYAVINKYSYVVIEVSSIGIDNLRVYGLDFKYMIMTNFSQDHLDYHKNMDNYLSVKGQMFSHLKSDSVAVLNSDCTSYNYLMNLCYYKVLSFGKDTFFPKNITYYNNRTEFNLLNLKFKTNLIGEFNIYNILASIRVILDLKYKPYKIKEFLNDFKKIDGRMEMFYKDNKTFIVDFAHTPSAVLNVFKLVSGMHFNKVYTVIGCGGDRDKKKRRIIGEILSRYSDYIILTNDNPRYENEDEIISDISQGIHKNYKIIKNRFNAIKEAYMVSESNDLILILGKGNESSINIKDKIITHNDIDAVKNIIGE